MMLCLDIVVFELVLIGSFPINIQVNLLILQKIVSLYAINTHVMLDSALKVESILFSLEIFFVDGDSSLAGYLEFDVFGFSGLFWTN